MSDTPIYDNVADGNPDPNKVRETKWWEKFLTPKFRRWAYGLTAAAVAFGAVLANKPEFIPVAGPLIMALYYVDKNGDPR